MQLPLRDENEANIQSGAQTDRLKSLSLPRATAAVVENNSWREALDHALHEVIPADSLPPDLVLLFASTIYAPDFPALVREARARTSASTLVGCSGVGVIGNGIELEHQAGLSLMAFWLPDAHIVPVRLHQEHLSGLQEDGEWERMTGLLPSSVAAWIMLGEPFRLDVQSLLEGLNVAYPGVPVVGGLSSSTREDRRGWVFLDDQVYDEGAIALAIAGPYSVLPVVSQGCDPIGEAWTVTGAERNVLTSISCRPALDVLHDTLEALPTRSRDHTRENLLVGFAIDEYRDEFHRGDYLARGVIGIDETRGSITVGCLPRVGQTVQFQVRDADVADIDLQQALTDARALVGLRTPVAGLLFDCTGRGQALFGSGNHDASLVQAAFVGLPVSGFSASTEIAPAGEKTGLHGVTATLALLIHEDSSLT